MATAKPTTDTLRELWELVRSYTLQETVDPLKVLGKSLAWGMVGAVLVGTGVFFLALAGLRALQTETTAFSGPLSSVVPYMIVVVAMVVVIGVVVLGISRLRASQVRELDARETEVP